MGDRVLFQVLAENDWQSRSPTVYGHWCGNATPAILRRLRERMKDRPGDVEYTAARLVQEVAAECSDGSTSIGLWNSDGVLTGSDSHGDAGIVRILVGKTGMRFEFEGGYLTADCVDGKGG